MPDAQKNAQDKLQNESFHRPFPTHSLCSPTPTALLMNLHKTNISQPWSSFLVYSFLSLSLTFPLAPSSYLRLTAQVRASSTSWCLQVSQPSPQNQRRNAHFLPRGSAPSARARTAWPTATRSERWDLWEEVKSKECSKRTFTVNGKETDVNVKSSLILSYLYVTDHVRIGLSTTLPKQVTFSRCSVCR